MQNYFEILRKCPLFEGVSEEECKSFFEKADFRIIDAEKEQMILEEGSKPIYI